MFTDKIKFKINTVTIPNDLKTKVIFLCFEVDGQKFYSISSKKIYNQVAKFYGQLIQVQIPNKQISIALIDNTNKNSLRLLKRISIKKNELSSKKVINHSIKEQKFQLKFQSKLIHSNKDEEVQTQTSLQDTEIFQDQFVDLYKSIAFRKNTKNKERKNSSDSSTYNQNQQNDMKRSRKYSEDLTDCCTPIYKESPLYQF